LERIAKELKKKHKKDKDKKKEAEDHDPATLGASFEVPVTAVKLKAKDKESGQRKEIVDERYTIVDDPCTYKVARGIHAVLVAMKSHHRNVDVQHCAAHLLRWVMAWGDKDVAHLMTEAQATDEIQEAMQNHPKHRSLQNHCKFALERLEWLMQQ
jgi:hypothetical protein